MYSKAQNKATQKYIKKAYDTFTIRFPKGDREKYQAFAKENGTSLNRLVLDLLKKEMTKY